MKPAQQVAECFARDIAGHELTIIRANGNDRHLRCEKPGTLIQHFQIVTWPGYLVYAGDMGSFTFWRTADMFSFFRNPEGKINPGYWAEKLVAVDRCDGYERFSVELFRENVKEHAREQLKLEEDAELPEYITEALEGVLRAEDEHECLCELRDFQLDTVDFTDFWEVDNHEYTTRFLWCCHAIVWAINRFDSMTAEKGGSE